MAVAKAEAQESSSPRCLLLLAGGLPSSVCVRGTILLAGTCKPLAYGTRLWSGHEVALLRCPPPACSPL